MTNQTHVDQSEDVFVLILKNGPIYSLEDYIEYQLEVLSKRFQGELWATGSFDADLQVGNFRVVIVKEPSAHRMLFFPSYYRRVLQRVRDLEKHQPRRKVVMTYDPFRNGLLGRLIKASVGWPLIVEVNGVYADRDNFIDSKGLIGRYLKPNLLLALGRYVLRRADGVRLLFREQLNGFVTLPPNVVTRQYFDAVRLDRFSPAPPEHYCLLVGFPFFRKGVDILLEAFDQVHRDFPDWKLVLIGHELARHIDPKPSYIEVIRGIPNKQAADWIRRCGIYVLASRSEGMGRVLLEAAAAGKARIAAAVGGTYTVINDGIDGILFQRGNPDSLAAALRKLMADAGLRKKLGDAAHVRVLHEFGAESYLEHVTDLVHSVIAARPGQ